MSADIFKTTRQNVFKKWAGTADFFFFFHISLLLSLFSPFFLPLGGGISIAAPPWPLDPPMIFVVVFRE